MSDLMQVTVRLSTGLFHEGPAQSVEAHAANGAFGLLPRHVDFVTALVPGVLKIRAPDGSEQVFGIDEGILVKHGSEVDICVRRAAKGDDLESLKRQVRESFVNMDEEERAARSALTQLEADIVRRFASLKDGRP